MRATTTCVVTVGPAHLLMEIWMEGAYSKGDIVRVVGVAPSGRVLPAEVEEVFKATVGRTLRVDEVDATTGCVALNVCADGSQADDWCQHTIWLEPGFMVRVASAAEAAG